MPRTEADLAIALYVGAVSLWAGARYFKSNARIVGKTYDVLKDRIRGETVTKRTVQNMIRSGNIPFYRPTNIRYASKLMPVLNRYRKRGLKYFLLLYIVGPILVGLVHGAIF